MNKPDRKIQHDVEAELEWTPDVDADEIVVAVTNGIVTLTGNVPNYYDKLHAELATKRVAGVTGIATDIRVRTSGNGGANDADIARRAVDIIHGDLPNTAPNIRVIVRDGHVTLEGEVEWQWQRQRIESTVRSLRGVDVVSNLIAIQPRVVADDIQRRIEDAFRRSAEVDAQSLSVEARNGEVTLRGSVRSLSEKEEAQRTAWSAPGVKRVVNEINVSSAG